MGRKAVDLTGQRFGKLVVIERSLPNQNQHAMWKCKCDCGNEVIRDGAAIRSDIKNGRTPSCGCSIHGKTEDMTGKVFGRLTVIKRDAIIPGSRYVKWICKCECGNEVSVLSENLKRGNTTSCGCFRKECSANRIEDLTGQIFGKLTVLSLQDRKPAKWLCKCECGNEVVVLASHLKDGHTKSCGCIKIEKKHPLEWKRIFRIWRHMKERCYNENVREYKWYGAKGVIICDEWLNSFESFFDWSIKNGYEGSLTIDRINPNGNYCPENCRWATIYVQARNKTDNTWITYNNETMVLSDWAKRYNINSATLYCRIYELGWSIEDALNIPTLNKWEKKDEYKANFLH